VQADVSDRGERIRSAGAHPGGAEASAASSRRPPAVRRAISEDVPRIVETLVRAFDDDPVPNFLFRGDRHRRHGLQRFFSIQLRHSYLADGEVWTTPETTGAAMWAPPAKARPGLRDLLHLLPLVPDLLGLGREAGTAMRLLQEVEKARPTQDHWYLATIGTAPGHQGRGIGSALLTEVLDRVDREGLPAYLESSKERNVPFYRRHGFEVTREIRLSDAPPLWLMWREPTSRS
jgi:ribosomal protein S18 acetylase RimI-like enzyme